MRWAHRRPYDHQLMTRGSDAQDYSLRSISQFLRKFLTTSNSYAQNVSMTSGHVKQYVSYTNANNYSQLSYETHFRRCTCIRKCMMCLLPRFASGTSHIKSVHIQLECLVTGQYQSPNSIFTDWGLRFNQCYTVVYLILKIQQQGPNLLGSNCLACQTVNSNQVQQQQLTCQQPSA